MFASRTALFSSFAASIALAAIVQIVPASAATQTTQQACSVQYQAAKAAGSLNGQKWAQFYSACAAQLNAASSTPATAPAPTTLPKAASNSSTKTANMLASGNSGHQTTQQICSAQYQAAKSAGTLNGQKWPAFLSSCSDSIKSYSDPSANTPPEPQTTAYVAPVSAQSRSSTAASSVQGKTPGEIAFQQRIHECASEWQSDKAAGSLPAGAKWPQFWSQCNTRLKASM